MRSKLHFGILIVLFTFLGRYVETSVAPNQQIVIQFSDAQISEENTQEAIVLIQSKLQSIDAEHIQIRQGQDGQLRITYYSNTEVEQIQHLLSDQQFQLAFNSDKSDSEKFPIEKDHKDYQLSISEIQQNSNSTNWDFESVEIVELNHKSDRFNNPKVKNFATQVNQELIDRLIRVNLKRNRTLVFLLEEQSYKIPEVRAGPVS